MESGSGKADLYDLIKSKTVTGGLRKDEENVEQGSWTYVAAGMPVIFAARYLRKSIKSDDRTR